MDDQTLDMTEEELKAKLTPEQYRVLREKGTEAPGSGKYLHEHTDGMFKCAACGNPLFSSDAKFDSGTGWPSFDQALPNAVKYEHDPPSSDFGVASRTEVLCAKCGSHLGHVFDDLPAMPAHAGEAGGLSTTGKRFCMNSVCLELDTKKEK